MCTCTMWLLSSSVFMVLKQKQRALEKSNIILVCMTKISLLSYLWGSFSTHKKSVQKRGEKTISNIYLPVVSEKIEL